LAGLILGAVDDHEPSLAPRQQLSCFVANFPFMIQLPPISARHKSLDDDV
jgi:hypothetical protein